MILLPALGIKLNNQKISTTLNYVLIKPRQKINLNLFEAEKYEPAVIVQQLIGTLVYYSNFGRYEPRLAESWRRTDDFTWEFNLKTNLRCQNGEEITANSFKKSIERSLFIFEKKGGVPILPSLRGYKEFILSNKNADNVFKLTDLSGIISDNNKIIFKFDKKIKSGFLQILSFSPLGYICGENLTESGSWKNDLKFISSGPYISNSIDVGNRYELIKNKYWKNFSKNAPEKIIFTHDDTKIDIENPTIIDAFTNEYENENFIEYKLVPEYLNSILIGNFEGFFKSKENRQIFKKIFDQTSKEVLPTTFGVNTRSHSFYPNQKNDTINNSNTDIKLIKKPSYTLKIEGTLPIEGTARWYAWKVLKRTLEKLDYKFEFANNEASFQNMTSQQHDFRIRGSSIGGGVEAWGLFVSFCSSMGINFPDPNRSVCNLVSDYENNLIDDQKLSELFLENVNDEAAILPVSHYGVKLMVNKYISTETFSPLLAIMKFDQITLR